MLVRRLRRRGGDGGKQREEVVPPKGGGFGSGTRARSSRPSVALAHRTCTHGSQLQAGQCGSGCPGAPLADLSTKVPPFFARPPRQNILRRKAPHICTPQARIFFRTTSQTAGFVRRLGRCVRAPGIDTGRPVLAAQAARAACSQPSIACHHTCLQRAHLPEANGVGGTRVRNCTEPIYRRTRHLSVPPSRDEIPSGSSPS